MDLDKKTDDLFKQLNTVKTDTELDVFIEDNTTSELDFAKYYNNILEKKGISLSAAVHNSNLDRYYAYQIANGSKKNPGKYKVVCMCIGAQMSLEETQRALKLTNNSVLYPKSTMDAIIIKHINNKNYSVAGINEDLFRYNIDEEL